MPATDRHRTEASLRVVTCSLECYHDRAMTRMWLRQASGVHRPRGPYTIAGLGLRLHPPSSFELRPTTRFELTHLTGWGPASLGVPSLTAPSSTNVTGRFRACKLPVNRFSQPHDGFRTIDSRVCSTPLALRGFRPLKCDTRPIVHRSRQTSASSPLPALHGFLPLRHAIPARSTGGVCPLSDPCRTGPSQPCGCRLPSWASADLEVLIPIGCASYVKRFHPHDAWAPPLAFRSFRGSLTGDPGLAASPSQGLRPPQGSSVAGDSVPC
jgi:hypothetical protein